MSRQRTMVIVAGIMLSLFMASMEATVIATAMPTIVAQLGGLSIYSWAFSAYMLTSTTTVPIYGKLSDIYGRRGVYAVAMGLFLVGSVLCGMAQSMEQLIIFRGLQGIGAGGVMPLVFIIIGDIFSFEQRAKMQGFFSGVWGVSSIVGPLLGGFLVDQISWHWVFYVNLLPGVVAVALVWFAWQETQPHKANVQIDYAGAALLMTSVVLLLLGLSDLGSAWGWAMLATAVALFVALVVVERRAADPILPLDLFRDRLFSAAMAHGVFAGWAMFGSISFVPLFMQTVLGTSAMEAGTAITPMMLGWVLASVVGGRLLLRMSYRTLALVGMVSLTVGAFLISQAGTEATRPAIMAYLSLMGIGMGLSVPSFLIAVQSTVERRKMGTATSTLQFSRSIGGTLGVSVMGAFLATRLAAGLTALGMDPASVDLNSMMERGSDAVVALSDQLRGVMAVSIEGVFVLAFVASALALVATTFSPAGRINRSEPRHPAAKVPAPVGATSVASEAAPER